MSFSLILDDGSPRLCTDYIGHVTYLPPEALAQTPFLPKPADMWSLGVCLVYIVFQTVPFECFLQEDILEQQMKHSWKQCIKEKLKESWKPIKDHVEHVIELCLCVKPNERTSIFDVLRTWEEVGSESLYVT